MRCTPELRKLLELFREFELPGPPLSIQPYGSGHIHDTYVSVCEAGGQRRRFLHQRINTHVFPDPIQLINNIVRVTQHLRSKVQQAGLDPARHCLSVVPTRSGDTLLRDAQGQPWRTYVFIEQATTYDVVSSPEVIEAAAAAFAIFEQRVADLTPPLPETIPGFDDVAGRFHALEAAVDADVANRALGAKAEIQHIQARPEIGGWFQQWLDSGEILSRTVHRDTKINNVLFDAPQASGQTQPSQALCVIDLDTVGSGTLLHDFGDLARFGTCTAKEDELNLASVGVDLNLFDALSRGYMRASRGFLSDGERDHLVDSMLVITMTAAVRFLTDYLSGDTYFKIQRPEHNLQRCRTQLALVADIESKTDALEAALRRYR